MGRFRGLLWLFTGLVVAALAGFVAFATLAGATQAQEGGTTTLTAPEVSVVVAARRVEIRSPLTVDDLERKTLPVTTVPEGAVRELSDAVGMVTLVDLYPGEVVLAQRLIEPNVTSADGRMALMVSGDQVLMAFPAKDLMSRVGVLKPGDQVDLLFTLEVPTGRALALSGASETGQTGSMDETELATFNVLQNVTVSAVVAGKTPTGGDDPRAAQAILLTVSPQDALILKFALDSQGIPDIVLRAPGADQPFETTPVDVDYMINRYQIPVEIGR